MEIKTYNCINSRGPNFCKLHWANEKTKKVIKLNYKLVISNKNEDDVKNTIWR